MQGEEEDFGKQVNLHFLDSIQLCSIDNLQKRLELFQSIA